MNLKPLLMLAGSAVFATLAAGPAAADGNLTVYCSVQEEWCQLMVNEFQKATGINVAMTRKSSGETYAQVKAEAANPQGDIWWGGTGDPASAGGRGRSDGCLRVADALASSRLGREPAQDGQR